jgi:hypothetical protein
MSLIMFSLGQSIFNLPRMEYINFTTAFKK